MKIFFLGLSLTLAAFSLGCKSKPSDSEMAASKNKSQEKKAISYTCPMHPQIHQDHKGQCPICGMNLEEESLLDSPAPTPNEHSSLPDGHAAFHLSRERQQMIGVKSGVVEKRQIFKTIDAAGRVAFDPELYAAQSEYLEAIKQLSEIRRSPVAEVRHSAEAMVESAKLRLRILGLSDAQIKKLPSMKAASLLPKQGENVWVYAEVFEMDLAYVAPGLSAQMTGTSLEGETLNGVVASVDRVINPVSRTAKVRIEVKNLKSRLRPESYVNVRILAPMGEQTVVPFDAVFDTGKQAWVFVMSDNQTFEPRLITVKFRADDWVAVASGLHAGEKIVTSANFLIDSESRLKGVQAEYHQSKNP